MQAVNEREALLAVAEAAGKVLAGFDAGIFVRSISQDNESGWAVKLLPYVAALGRLQQALAALDKLTKVSVDKNISTE